MCDLARSLLPKVASLCKLEQSFERALMVNYA